VELNKGWVIYSTESVFVFTLNNYQCIWSVEYAIYYNEFASCCGLILDKIVAKTRQIAFLSCIVAMASIIQRSKMKQNCSFVATVPSTHAGASSGLWCRKHL